VATRRGAAGSVASSTATPLLSGLGQKRVLEPLAKSEKPQLLVRRLRGRRTGDDGGEARDRGDGETAT
jgi:hypothetical protein